MALFDKVSDGIINKVSGRNIETIDVNLEQFVQLLDKEFLSKANGDDEYQIIYDVIKGHYLKNEKYTSKDGKFEIWCGHIKNHTTIFNAKDRFTIWIQNIEKDKYFQYRALGPGSLKKTVKNRINEYKMGIATSDITYHIEDETIIDDNPFTPGVGNVFCTNCGKKIDVIIKFCPNCGKENLARK